MDKKTKKYIEIKKHEPHPNFDGYKNYKDYPMPHPDSETQPFKNKEYPNLFNGNKKAVRDFVKRMMGRIVFLYFIQKKGWLAVPKGKNWGEGNYDYLYQLYKETPREDQPYFYEKYLAPLFFECFTDKKSESETNDLRFPYLNGGLFDKTQDQHFDKVNLPYSIFTELFDTFNSYNFTVHEDAPNEHTVAVDPEMLGHIFENLLEDNKDKGAFYTPKEIVHYMCKESLKTFLLSKIVSDNNQSEKAKDVITKIIEHQPLNEEERKYINEKGNVITTSLENVKICDPAIGSGAFPMGFLQEIYYIKITLQQLGITTEQTDAQIKKHIIEKNIYGVDIDAGAVDIARLRFWLSLVVDEQLPQPLPNLDFKIMQGNSLLESYQGVDLSNLLQDNNNLMLVENAQKDLFGNYVEPQLRITFTKKDFTESLQQDIKKYFSITDAETKKSLKKQINNKIQEHIDYNLELRRNHLERLKLEITPKYKNATLTLKQEREKESLEQEITKLDISRKEIIKLQETDEKPFFLWHIYFADVFKGANNLDNSGFDIVIGNPPYGAKLSQEDKEVLKKKYISAQTIKGAQKGSLDTYTLFIELGYNLLKKQGHLGFIVPLSVTSSDALSGLHNLLINNCEVIKISSYGDRPKRVFESAEQQVSIISFLKTQTKAKEILMTGINKRYSDDSLWVLLDNLKFSNAIGLLSYGRIPKIGTDTEQVILQKLLKNNNLLSDLKTEKGSSIYYRKAGGRYYKIITKEPTESSAEGNIIIENKYLDLVGAILSSNLFYWFWLIHSDWHNMRTSEIEKFPIPYNNFDDKTLEQISELYNNYLADLKKNAKKTVTGLNIFVARKSKHIIDQIDDLICPLYGLTQEEIDFIKNYEIEFRLSDND